MIGLGLQQEQIESSHSGRLLQGLRLGFQSVCSTDYGPFSSIYVFEVYVSLFSVYECVTCMYVCATRTCLMHTKDKRGHQIP